MGLLRRWFGEAKPAPRAGAADPAGEASGRFAEWVARQLGRSVPDGIEGWGALDALLQGWPPTAPSEAMLEDAAAWLGEGARRGFGGYWQVDAVLGPVVGNLGGVGCLRLRPLDAARKKWELRGGLSLATFGGRLSARIEAERRLPAVGLPAASGIASRYGQDPAGTAAMCARVLGEDWKRRFGGDLPVNLRSVRELDRWMRTQYLVCGSVEEEWLCAGFLVGEVARGLFGGEWVGSGDPVRASLRHPELDLKPVGRVYRMLTELPEGEPLEDYVRVLPAARRELRGGG